MPKRADAVRVLISGASGFLGTALTSALVDNGHEVVKLVRREPGKGEVLWRPAEGFIDTQHLQRIDAAVNLAGENIFGRWNDNKKAKILVSRRDATQTIAKCLATFRPLPKVLVSMSGVNYYGDRGGEELDESSSKGKGFLADVCEIWEASAQPARDAGVRVVHPRMAVVLDKEGGALQKMLLPFKLGLGGKFGNGNQYMSWIALHDAIAAIVFALSNEKLAGPVNFSSPNPVPNKDFASTLARTLHRPAFATVPAFALRAVLGRQAADELLLGSTRVSKSKLTDAGFQFTSPDLKSALQRVL